MSSHVRSRIVKVDFHQSDIHHLIERRDTFASISGRLHVWCGGHIISSCGGSTRRLMGRFHPAPHIGSTETCYTKTHVEDSAYNTKLPESWRTLSPLVISLLYIICNPRPRVCYRSLGASSSIVYTHAQCLVFTCTLYTPLSLIYSTRSRQGKTLPRITIQPNSQGYPTK